MSGTRYTTRFMRVIPDVGNMIGEVMKAPSFGVLISIVIFLTVGGLFAQNPTEAAYLNQALSPAKRAADLVHRMTVEEKVTQLVNQSRAVPGLNVSYYDWARDALHGVA